MIEGDDTNTPAPSSEVRDFERDAALERAMTRILFDAGFDETSSESFERLLTTEGVATRDRRALIAQGAARLLLYRRLVEGTLRGAIETIAPITSAHLQARLAPDIRGFLAEHGPRGRTLREVVHQFVANREPIWVESADVPEFITDLAAYELAVIDVAAAPDPPKSPADVPLSLERPLAFIEGRHLGAYAYKVNEVELVETAAPPAPEPGETFLLVYRSLEHRSRCLSLSPLAYSILSNLFSAQPLGKAIENACNERGEALTQPVVEGTATLLSDLARLGVLLGPT